MMNMFYKCSNLASIYVTRNKWIIKNGCNTSNMFINCGVSEVTYKDAA